ncbi:Biopolymer transport protein ExbB [Polystyrenella longa]|uniref:Biopolymer transport protein ExbB n=1 Tax=Polystyrenella longa TaxID=2528007 RepID=A0A518CGL6_9PLAN|nr:MotA/TolQ/ExbB proton channel family protein [Polystyrenella longa]QDU78357.1 Biopolymer transport protein ExbB [Polystyrenella longa]
MIPSVKHSSRPSWIGFCWTMLCAAVLLLPLSAYAQPADDGDAGANVSAPPVANAAAADTANETRPQESYLSWMVRSSGLFGLLLLLLSFVMVAVITMNALQVRRSVLMPPDFIEEFEELLNAKKYQDAYALAREDDSFLGRVLAAGLSRINKGYNESVSAMQEAGEDEAMGLEHKLSYLALIGQIAPMIGLMGTVYGMINSFRVIASLTTQPKPYEIADGISTALFTTLEGLGVAIPAMIAYSLIHNNLQRYVLEVGMLSEGFMNRFSSMGKAGTANPKG